MSFETRHPTLLALLGIAVVLAWALLFALYQRHRYPAGGATLEGDGIDVLSAPEGIKAPYRLYEPAPDAPPPLDPRAVASHGGRVVQLGERAFELVVGADGAVGLWPARGALPGWG